METSKVLQRSLEKLGMKFEFNTKIEAAKVGEKGVELQGVQGDKKVTYSADLVLVSVGRRPFVAGLDCEKAGVKMTARGRIAIDEHWQTSLPGVYSIGDVVDGPMLAHKAHEEGVAVSEHLAGKPGHVNYSIIPGVIYTAPEAASVGITEDEAKEKKLDIRVGKFSFTANGRAIANDTQDGFAKIIADAKTDKVLGVHIVASCASELISEAVVLMEFGGSAEDLARTIHAHPTMSEAVKEAALAVDGRMLSA